MTYSNTDYRICVYRSPERYDDYHREYIEIPNLLPVFLLREEELPNQVIQSIRLQRYRASLHVSYGLLRDSGLDFRTQTLNSIAQNQNIQALLLTIFRTVSHETDRRLREEERGIPEHTVILDKVEVILQPGADRLLVGMIFYACQHQDSELGLRYFQDSLQRLIYNTRRTFHQDGRMEINFSETLQELEHNREWLQEINGTFPFEFSDFKKYDKKAEERALKLLKSILTQEAFEIYTKDGYVMVEGKSHKMYKVRKNTMIGVSEKQKDGLYKDYRLCIEPKNHGTICPTDEVIAKIKLIQADENKLHKIAKRFEGK